MMKDFDLLLKFGGESEMRASRSANQLCDALTRTGIVCDIVPDEDTQDAGVIVGIVLGSAALIEIARGIADYVRRYNVSDIEVVGKSKTIRISNVNSKDVSDVLDEISKAID